MEREEAYDEDRLSLLPRNGQQVGQQTHTGWNCQDVEEKSAPTAARNDNDDDSYGKKQK